MCFFLRFQHLVGGGHLFVNSRIARVCHMQKQVGLAGLFESRLETFDQVVRQIANETDRVAKQHRTPTGQLPASGSGVECCEKHIFDKDVRLGQRTH